jgi:hypothetical protein
MNQTINSMRRTLLACIIITFAGCATPISTLTLKKPDSPSQIVLKEDFTYPTGGQGVWGVIAGTYTAEYIDDNGTFFRGPGACMINFKKVPTIDGNVGLLDGGIYVAKSGTKSSVTVYRYLWLNSPKSTNPTTQVGNDLIVNSSNPVQAGLGAGIGLGVVDSIIASERGKLVIHPKPKPEISLEELLVK